MKFIIMIVLSNLLAIAVHASAVIVVGGECGKYKPSLRAIGVSSISRELAHEDAFRLANISCKNDFCKSNPGSGISASCGIHDYQVEDEIHYVTADYLCVCAF